jgi:Baseplate J-like protein
LDRVNAAIVGAEIILLAATASNTIVRFAWQDVGEILPTPRNSFDGITKTLSLLQPLIMPSGTSRSILLEDVNDRGLLTKANLNSIDSTLQLIDLPTPQIELKSPLKLLLNLLPVSRGETVNDEILGSGNASVAGQEFVLQKSPLTYLLSDESTSGENYKSTLIIQVNDIEWKEVPSFYGQAATARIFVTREDEEQKTHVLFGDGINGARLPSGIDNIAASYRFGSGKESPDTGTLNVIVKPYPNLKSIRNPVAVGGGADPDPPEQIRRYAPRSILTFGRAVSGDDYETIAAQTPGVARAKAYWNWDAAEQRTLVLVYVGDDLSAVENTKIALKNSADPNRPILVKPATKIPIQIDLSVQIDPIYKTSTVIDRVRSVLIDPELGLFGIGIIPIGKSIYTSEIYAACLSIQGVIAVHNLNFYRQINGQFELNNVYRHDPGEGNFYHLQSTHLNVTPEV